MYIVRLLLDEDRPGELTRIGLAVDLEELRVCLGSELTSRGDEVKRIDRCEFHFFSIDRQADEARLQLFEIRAVRQGSLYRAAGGGAARACRASTKRQSAAAGRQIAPAAA
jgi:hypothetical protein